MVLFQLSNQQNNQQGFQQPFNLNTNLIKGIWLLSGRDLQLDLPKLGQDYLGQSQQFGGIYLSGILPPLFNKLDALRPFLGEPSYQGLLLYKELHDQKISWNQFEEKLRDLELFNPTLQISFKTRDAESFLKLNSVLSDGPGERDRVSLLAFWLGQFGANYDYERLSNGASIAFTAGNTGMKVIENYLAGQKTGICGDINGTAANLIAYALGLKQTSFAVNTEKNGHIISFINGNEGFYAVDYGNAYSLGTDIGVALDRVSLLVPSFRFDPFLSSYSPALFFVKSPTQDVLDKTLKLGWGEEQLKLLAEGFNASFNAGDMGQIGLSLGYKIKKANIGLFYINAPTSAMHFEGMYIDWRNFEGKSGSVFIPRVNLAIMHAGQLDKSYAQFMCQLVPYCLNLELGGKSEIKATPLAIDFSQILKTNSSSLRLTSTLGYYYNFEPGSKGTGFKFQMDAGILPDEQNLYYIGSYSPRAFQFTAGLKDETGEVDVKYAPGSWGANLDLKTSFNLIDSKNIRIGGYLELEMLDPNNLFSQAKVGFNIGLK